MRYIKDGATINANHIGQIAHSDDGVKWSYVIKSQVREISGYKTFIRLWFNKNEHFEINLVEIQGRPTWSTGDASGLAAALEDISNWLAESSVELAIQYLTQIKKYEFAISGSKIIQASNGLVHGNWFAIRTHQDTVFTTITDKGSNLIGAFIPASFVYPERNMLFTSDLDGNGFTGIQVQSGIVEAYNK